MLGLTWKLILKFEIQDFGADEAQLLRWVRARAGAYDGVEVTTWRDTFHNGAAFCALIHSAEPNAIVYSPPSAAESSEVVQARMQHAFDVAEAIFAVPQLLSASEIVASHEAADEEAEMERELAGEMKMGSRLRHLGFDERSLITYVAKLRQALREHRVRERERTATLRAEFEEHAAALAAWIKMEVRRRLVLPRPPRHRRSTAPAA